MDIIKGIRESIDLKTRIISDAQLLESINKAASIMLQSSKNGGRLFFAGNGGSAADAQHLSSELTAKFLIDRPGIDAEALHTNASHITAMSNDHDFTEAYARVLEAKGRAGDVLILMSTSGNSENLIKCAQQANTMNIRSIAMTGMTGGRLINHCELTLQIPDKSVPRIQEVHMLVGHLLCEHLEHQLYGL